MTCDMCGREARCEHHLIFGTFARRLADEDGLTLNLCNECHNMGDPLRRIHGNMAAEKLSKMLGQAIWELNECSDTDQRISARDAFRGRYGRSYL